MCRTREINDEKIEFLISNIIILLEFLIDILINRYLTLFIIFVINKNAQ